MKVTLFHEIDPTSKDKVLNEGIKRKANGGKNNSEKKKVDTFLDTHLPDWAKEKEVCRGNVLYAFLERDGHVVDITDGEPMPVSQFMDKSQDALLKITVDSGKCYVSDLDLYDTLMRAMQLDEQDSTREHLADRYWERVIPLEKYELGTIRRPEVMVATDVEPGDIEVVKAD
jgi:hypothetical protein